MIGKVMLFNPFTGTPRHPDDIKDDPTGLLVWDGEEPLRASAPQAEPSALHAQLREALLPLALLADAADAETVAHGCVIPSVHDGDDSGLAMPCEHLRKYIKWQPPLRTTYITMRDGVRARKALAALASAPQASPTDDLRELAKWLNEQPNRDIDRRALSRVLVWAQASQPPQGAAALATSDPEGHRQAIVDAQADAAPAPFAELADAIDALDESLDDNVPYGRTIVYEAMQRVKTALQPLLAAPPQGAFTGLLQFVQHCSTLSGGMVSGNILAAEAMKALAASPLPATQEPAAIRALRAIRLHWREFGPEHGFDETLERNAAMLDSLYAAPAPADDPTSHKP